MVVGCGMVMSTSAVYPLDRGAAVPSVTREDGTTSRSPRKRSKFKNVKSGFYCASVAFIPLWG